jgi:hypothetical protein
MRIAKLMEDGGRQVAAFYFPGTCIGFDERDSRDVAARIAHHLVPTDETLYWMLAIFAALAGPRLPAGNPQCKPSALPNGRRSSPPRVSATTSKVRR